MTRPILVMGATSGIGAQVIEEARTRGISVRAFSRSAGEIKAGEFVEPCPGDARSPEDVKSAILGTRAVIYCLGIKERIAMLWEYETLFSESTQILMEAMKATGTRRLVAVTGFGAGRSREAMSALERHGHKIVLGKPYRDKDRQEALIMSSDLDWTIARPVILRNSPKSGRLKVLRDPSTWRNGLVSRADVSAYLLDAVEDDLDIGADVVLSR